jgi:hypothetical protein
MVVAPLCVEQVPGDMMRWDMRAKPSNGQLNPPFLRPDDVVYHGGDHCVFEMFLDASRLTQMNNLSGTVTTISPVTLKSRFDPHLWGGVVPFKLVTPNSRVAMAHYEFAKANCKRLHDTGMGDPMVRVVLTISNYAFTKALLQHRVLFDCTADGVMFRKPIIPEFYDDINLEEKALSVNTIVSNELPRLV